jgi:transcription initiation factor TFIID subunit 11
MTTPYASFNTTPTTPSGANAASNYFMTPTPPPTRGRPRGSAPGTGAKRGRKPRGGSTLGTNSPRIPQGGLTNVSSTQTGTSSNYVHWAVPSGTGPGEGITAGGSGGTILQGSVSASPGQSPVIGGVAGSGGQQPRVGSLSAAAIGGTSSQPAGAPLLDMSNLISLPGAATLSAVPAPTTTRPGQVPAEEDGEGDDEILPAMADDDYSAQLSWQSQSKDNLKCVLSSESYR